VQKSREAWRRLGMRLRSVTPGGLARLLLVAGVLATLGWALNRSFLPVLAEKSRPPAEKRVSTKNPCGWLLMIG
jgi:hypothetical protein